MPLSEKARRLVDALLASAVAFLGAVRAPLSAAPRGVYCAGCDDWIRTGEIHHSTCALAALGDGK